MLNLIHKRNSNKGSSEIAYVAYHNGKDKRSFIYTVLLKMWGNKLIYFIGGSVNWYNLCEKQFDNIYEKF